MTDLSGKWALSGETLGPDGAKLYDWSADVTIAQSGEEIRVVTETSGVKETRSLSFAEKLVRKPSGELHLRYGYELDPDHPVAQTREFYGLAELTFAPDGKSATGSSCNKNPERYVIARLSLTRA
ncbi:MAG: hypothetical protein R3265_03800 [Hyphomonas sp.]|nr:hypothetical protein [Hyphomonas sp.]